MSAETRPFALFFPGQGSQHKGMGIDYYANSPQARKVFEKADKLALKLDLGYSITRLCFDDPNGELSGKNINTAKIQPALLTVDIAIYEHLLSMGLKPPSFVAGHSAGKFIASVAGGSVDFETGFEVMVHRGEQMRKSNSTQDGIVGIIDVKGQKVPGLDAKRGLLGVVQDAFAEMGPIASSFQPTGENSLTQVMFSGLRTQVGPVLEGLGKIPHRVLQIYEDAPVSHSPLMADAQHGFNNAIDALKDRIKGLSLPLIDDRGGSIITSSGELIASLTDHLVEPISWRLTVMRAVGEGVPVGFEVGPGKVLRGISTHGTGLEVYTTGSLKEVEIAKQRNQYAFDT